MRGKSAAEESREAILEKARLQREARQEKKKRDHAATVVQVQTRLRTIRGALPCQGRLQHMHAVMHAVLRAMHAVLRAPPPPRPLAPGRWALHVRPRMHTSCH